MAEKTHAELEKYHLRQQNPYRCPKCGRALILKEGRYGRFMACPNYPDCQYTKALWAFEKPYCEKCKGEELLPFIKNGNVIPYAWVYCECHEEREHYWPISPDDFDFPMSYDYYRSLCQDHGWHDPGSQELPIEVIPVYQDMQWTNRQWDVINQLGAKVKFLHSEVIKLQARLSRKGKSYI